MKFFFLRSELSLFYFPAVPNFHFRRFYNNYSSNKNINDIHNHIFGDAFIYN